MNDGNVYVTCADVEVSADGDGNEGGDGDDDLDGDGGKDGVEGGSGPEDSDDDDDKDGISGGTAAIVFFVGGAVGFIAIFVLKGTTRKRSGLHHQNSSNEGIKGRELEVMQMSTPSPTGAAAVNLKVASETYRMQALYDYRATEPDELSFTKGAYLTVTKKDSSGWWHGRLDSGQTGIFPSNYVKPTSFTSRNVA